MMDDTLDQMEISDLGDATVETKQRAPVPPFYADSVFAFGDRPNVGIEVEQPNY